MTDLADSLPPLPASPVPSEPVVLADYLPQEKPVLIPRAERHLKFYLDFVTFEVSASADTNPSLIEAENAHWVEDRLFMVPKYQFTQRSTKFVADFLGPTVDEQTPIKLEGVEKADFQALLSLMYPL
ncbi:hypothetical protein DXG03_002919 [Asterophora parasitica]|uniref:BTB domain-containing protein n=1 Tax=Asterophora parasitica TaxID=117018 RepID=A0A9P7GFX9_9AGAR|nr:hypothetical protein DXG03_002919 [Asterophora parasitica]